MIPIAVCKKTLLLYLNVSVQILPFNRILSLFHFNIDKSKILKHQVNPHRKLRAERACTVLQGQPQISYALIALMVKINDVNVDVLQVSHLRSYPSS